MLASKSLHKFVALLAGGLLVTAVGCSPPPDGNGGDEDTGASDAGGDVTPDPFDVSDDTSDQDPDTGPTPDTGQDTSDDTSGTMDTWSCKPMVGDTGGGGGFPMGDGGLCDPTMGSSDAGSSSDAGVTCTYFPDNCGSGQNCYPAGQGGSRQCAAFNSQKTAGASCSGVNDCAAGLICDPTVQQNNKCLKKCDPNAQQNCCPSGSNCLEIVDQQMNSLGFGVCQPECTMWPNDSCGQGEKCVPTQDGKTCVSHGSGGVGSSCTLQAPADCKPGTFCIQGTCTHLCTDGTCCTGGTSCTQTQQDFKICQ